MDNVTDENVSEGSDSHDLTFGISTPNKEPHFITKYDLSDLVRGFDLSKDNKNCGLPGYMIVIY